MHSVGQTLTVPRGACNLIEVAGHGYTDKSYNYMMLNIHQNVTRQEWLITEWEPRVVHMLCIQKSEVTVGGSDLSGGGVPEIRICSNVYLCLSQSTVWKMAECLKASKHNNTFAFLN